MNTLKSIPTKMKSGAAILPLIIALFFMASCSKDESVNPMNKELTPTDAARFVKPGLAEGFATINDARDLNLLQIEHKSRFAIISSNTQPDYSVIIQSYGIVIYEGRANVKRLGKVQFTASAQQLRKLNMLWMSVDFAKITDKVELIPNHPVNITTFRGKTLIDYGQGDPAQLIELRQATEDILQISQYVKGNVLPGVIGKSDL
jgi:hypothetical protein